MLYNSLEFARQRGIEAFNSTFINFRVFSCVSWTPLLEFRQVLGRF